MTNLEAQWTMLPTAKTAMAGEMDVDALKDAINAFTRAYRGARKGVNVCSQVSEGFDSLGSFLETGGSQLVGAAQFASAASRRIDRVCR